MASRFRTSFTQMAGNDPAEIVQAKVVNVNMVNYTVDVYAQFDQKRYFDIQVMSPYLHYSQGEGMSVMPEPGAKCVVCLPSDSTSPFVMGFVMPLEVVDLATPDAPSGTTSQSSPGASSSGASFAGGRPKASPGDMYLRTRDNNFIILHRGGVLQIGATNLAQRIYIPLNHVIADFSQIYEHFNAGGSVRWGLQQNADENNLQSEYTHSFRVMANDKAADVRVKVGTVNDFIAEPVWTAEQMEGNEPERVELGLGEGTLTDGTPNFIVTEICISQDGFDGNNGNPIDQNTISNNVNMRMFFDRAGGAFVRCQGSVLLSTKKKLFIRAIGLIDVQSEDQITVTAKNGMILDGGEFLELKSGSMRLNGGNRPVAFQGSVVQVVFPFTPVMATPTPLPLAGAILTGEPGVMV